MSFKSWMSYGIFANKVRTDNRYIHDGEINSFLDDVLETSKELENVVELGKILFRSQVGNDWEPEIINGEQYGERAVPYPPDRMKPLRNEASEGRANPKGIPYLYLASNKETAISEVRPWHGADISLGLFETLKDLKVINVCHQQQFGNLYFYANEQRSKEEIRKEVWGAIGKAFTTPVTKNDKIAEYVPTQILAELFKNNGYDGLLYKSAFTDGYNVVLFDIEAVNLIRCDLYEVEGVSYSFKDYPAVSYTTKQ